MYSPHEHALMVADQVRADAYAQALERTVRPGHVVVDIGSGSGVFAVLACRFGARRVFAIEPDPVIAIAQRVAEVNGYADRIEFIADASARVILPEPADVIVSDIRSVLPFFTDAIPTIIDARRRFLKPGGTLIPRRDVVHAVPVEAPVAYRPYTTPVGTGRHAIDLTPLREAAAGAWSRLSGTTRLLASPKGWTTIDYDTVDTANAHGTVAFPITESGVGHGLAVWFDTVLTDDVRFSNEPRPEAPIYGRAFFPWPAPVPLATGDEVVVTMAADLVGREYVWRWTTRVLSAPAGVVKAQFAQSTFGGQALLLEQLHRLDAEHRPEASPDGEVARFVLTMMDGRTTLAEIAARVAAQFPLRFQSAREARTTVGRLSLQYGYELPSG